MNTLTCYYNLPYDGRVEALNGDMPERILPIIMEEIESAGYVIRGRKTRVKWSNVVAAFDIETTRIPNDLYDPKEAPIYSEFNIVFCWQLKLGGLFIFGRNISNYFALMRAVNDKLGDTRLIIWVHNLSYEYNNLADYFAGASILFKSKITPVFIDHDNIQYRCSAQLTHKSLDQIGKQIGYNKLKDDFDYNIARSPKTRLKTAEVNYCYRDVEIVKRFIEEETAHYCESKGRDFNPSWLPYTQTGYPRADIKTNFSYTSEGRAVLRETALTLQEYLDINPGFIGGYTHGNFRHIARRCFGIKHLDIVSAYPAVMVLKRFPWKLTKATNLNTRLYFKNLYREDFAQVACITFKRIRLKKGHVPYMPVNAKSSYKGLIEENGKVVIASEVTMTITDVDMRLIVDNYNFNPDDIVINSLYFGIKKPLPRAVVDTVLDYFNAKTTLKGVEGKEYDYNLAKQKLNGIYGLSATALLRDLFEVDRDTLETIPGEVEYKPATVLPYQWALYITAEVRNIIYGMISAMDHKTNFIYSDTDSIFYFPDEQTEQYVANYNAIVKSRLELLRNEYPNIIPVSPKGKAQYLGLLLEEDDDIAEFCCIGAKRYYIKHSDGLYDVTISGLRATKEQKVTVNFEAFGNRESRRVLTNGTNTERLIDIGGGDLHAAFMRIREGSVRLPYIESVDKLTGVNLRGHFEGHIGKEHFTRPCSYVLKPVDTTLTLNRSLFDFLKNEELEEFW